VKRIFPLLFLLTAQLCAAQTPTLQEQEVQVPGQIVYRDSTTADVTFFVLKVRNGFSVENLESKVRYLDKNGAKKKLRPRDAEEIRFKWDNQEIRMVSRRPGHEALKRKFLHLMVDGKARFYEYIKTYRFIGRSQMYYARISTVIYWFVEREGKKMYSPRPFHFRQKMSKYFSDCPQLSERIKAGAYKAIETETIVKYYNANCK
jgi:hypothetical protein